MDNSIKNKEPARCRSDNSPVRPKNGCRGSGWTAAATVLATLLFISSSAEAFLFHATRRAAARRIMSRGLNPAKFRGRARFGKGLYMSRKISTALAEKGKKSAVIRMKPSRYLKRHILDLRRPTKKKLRSLLGRKIKLRGRLKRWIIGPKLGRRLGRIAGRKGRVIQYRSVKTGGTNLMIPRRLIKKMPKIIRPKRIIW